MQNNNYTFQIYYSKQYKLYDLTILNNNTFHSHYHLTKKKDINEAQLDFHYLTSPAEIEKKLSMIGFYDYQPIKYANIFFDISDFTEIHNKISNLKNSNGKKIQKK